MSHFGRYQVLREIARGGMGAVYEVRAPGDPRRLALKVIAGQVGAEELARFQREAELMARVRHPNLIGIHTFERAPGGQPFMVSDLIEGETLTELVRREAPSPERVRSLLTGLCLGLEALHAHGILHRDLKPDNVLVRPDGTPILLDFGIARELDTQSLTQSGALLGTPGFMAPEQAQGVSFQELDARTDVYGLGAILYFLLARQPPFSGASLTQVLINTLEEPIDWGPTEGAPADLVRVAARALKKSTQDRYAAVADLRRDLVDEARPPRSSALPLALFGSAALIVAAALGFALTREPPPTPSPSPSATASPAPEAPLKPVGECQVLAPGHPPRSEALESSRVRFLSNTLFLQHCAHSSKLRFIERDPDGDEWRGQDSLRLDPGSALAYPQDGNYARPPAWALAWGRVGEFVEVDLRKQVAERRELQVLDLNELGHERDPANLVKKLGTTRITVQHCRSSDHNLLVALASDPPARAPIRVFDFNWGRRQLRRYHPERDLKDAPANVRALINLRPGTTVAVGQRAGGPPLRIWFIGTDMTQHGSWPNDKRPVQLPEQDATSVVGLHLHTRQRFVLWGDRAGQLHIVRWSGPNPKRNEAEGIPVNVGLDFGLDQLPGPVLGLATVWRRDQLLIFAGSGSSEGSPDANELRVYALGLGEKTSLELLARRRLRPSGYTWLAVSHDAKWLLATRADCSIEAWPVAELLGE